jgi:hypothetical protein
MTSSRVYRYVGPENLLDLVRDRPAGSRIDSVADLGIWLEHSQHSSIRQALLPATYVVDRGGALLLAARGSEHVVCAGGHPVLAAGELFFDGLDVVEATNQSTGYCPEPSSWPAVERSLDRAGVGHPGAYTATFVFRRCMSCGQLNIVKDGWYACAVCDGALPETWNCDWTS